MRSDDSLGVDIAGVDDITPRFECASGVRNVAMAIARRLCTDRGGLWYAGEYGENLANWLNHEVTKGALHDVKSRVERQALKDERVETATASVTWDAQTGTMHVRLTGKTRMGAYQLVVAVDQAGARIVEGT